MFVDPDQHLVAEVTLGRLGVGVDDEGVRDLQPLGHLDLHPGRTTWNKSMGDLGELIRDMNPLPPLIRKGLTIIANLFCYQSYRHFSLVNSSAFSSSFWRKIETKCPCSLSPVKDKELVLSKTRWLFKFTFKLLHYDKIVRAAKQRKSGSEGLRLAPPMTFRCRISVKMYPSSCDLFTQYQFKCEMYWLTVLKLYVRDVTRAQLKNPTPGLATFKSILSDRKVPERLFSSSPAMTEVDLSLFPRMGLTLPSRFGGTKKFPSQLVAPTLELKSKERTWFLMLWTHLSKNTKMSSNGRGDFAS